jgi:hypothetical protein
VHLPGNGQPVEEQSKARPGLPLECLHILETRRPNLLLIGSPVPIAAVMQMLERSLVPPMVSWPAGQPAHLPRAIGTLVVHDADRLTPHQQAELHAWLNRHADQQVITIASESLFSLVMRNLFSDVLFYRLNGVSLLVDEVPQPT